MKLRAKASVINLKRARAKSRLMVASFLALALIVSSIAPLQYSQNANAAIGDYLTKHVSGKGDMLDWSSILTSTDGSKLYAIATDNAFFSDNGGSSWTSRALPSNPNGVVTASSDLSKLAFIGTTDNGDALFVSTDGGVSWQNRGTYADPKLSADGNTLIASQFIPGVEDDFSDQRYVLQKSTNNGASWTAIIDQNTEFTGTQSFNYAISANGTHIAVNARDGLFTSTNGGTSWSQRHANTMSFTNITISNNGQTLAATAYSDGPTSLYVSQNGGTTWTMGVSNESWSIYDWINVSASPTGQYIIAGTQGAGSYFSKDYGATWSQATAPGTQGRRSVSVSANGLVMASAHSSGSIYLSKNSGTAWEQQTIVGAQNWRTVASSANGSTIVAGSTNQGKVHISRDHGETWSIVESIPGDDWITSAISADGQTIIFAGANNPTSLYVSVNGGVTWQNTLNLGENTYPSWQAVTMDASGQHITLLGAYAAYTSSDYGATWTNQGPISGTYTWRKVATTGTGEKVYAISEEQLFVSNDYGSTWELSDTISTDYLNKFSDLSVSKDGRYLVLTKENEKVYISNDYAATWVAQNSLGDSNWKAATMSDDGRRISIADSSQYGQPGGTIYVSSDYGVTWNAQDTLERQAWLSLASTGNGTRLIGLGEGTAIYSLQLDQPTIKLAPDANSDEQVTLGEADTENRRTITNRTPVFSGKTFPGGAVTVTVNSDPITCETVADAQGNWSCELPETIPFGNHTIRAAMLNPSNGSTEPIGPFLIAAVDSSTLPGEGGEEGNNGGGEGTGNGATPGAPNTGFQKFASTVTERPIIATLILISGLSAAGLLIAAAVLRKKQR